MASAIAILDSVLTPLISRTYTLDLLPFHELISQFQKLYKDHQTKNTLTPILNHNGINYLFVQSGDLILLLICYYQHVNVLELFTFLYKLEGILKSYFQGQLNRGCIVDSFDLVYELFDEVMDFGIPQLTEVGILKDVIKLEVTNPELGGNHKNNVKGKGKGKGKAQDTIDADTRIQESAMKEVNSSVLRGSTSKISWRPKGLYYPRNELFVDLIEHNTLVIHNDFNKIIRNEVQGEVKLKCYLTGMPVLKLQLNEVMKKFDKDSVTLAQFVDLWRYGHDSTIHFIPPDGESTLLSYKILNFNKKPLIQIKGYTTKVMNGNKLQVKLTIGLNVKIKSNFKDIQISLPKPIIPESDSPISSSNSGLRINFEINPRFKTKFGKVLYDFTTNRIIWSMDSFQGNEINQIEELTMSSQFSLYDSQQTATTTANQGLGMNPPPRRNTPLFSQIKEGLKPDDDGDDDEEETTTHGFRDEIRISFKLENETYTGLKIQYLKLEREYQEYKGDVWGQEEPQENHEQYKQEQEEKEKNKNADNNGNENDNNIKAATDSGYKLEYTLFPWIRYMCCSTDEFVYRVK